MRHPPQMIMRLLVLSLLLSLNSQQTHYLPNMERYYGPCDDDPSSHKEVHKHWSKVGVQKYVYLEQMCKNVQINRVKNLKHRLI